MIETNITIINKLGLHARAAAKLIKTTSRFSAKIEIAKEGQWVDSKSIMSVMMLAASQGSELQFRLDGDDEEAAWEAISALINDYFEEGE